MNENQYLYPTMDYIFTLNYFGSNNKYININNIPLDRNKWNNIIINGCKQIHKSEFEWFIEKVENY